MTVTIVSWGISTGGRTFESGKVLVTEVALYMYIFINVYMHYILRLMYTVNSSLHWFILHT